MRRVAVALGAVLLLLWATVQPARAGSVIDRIRADGVLHCGAVERPGIAEAPPQAAPSV